MNKTAVVNYSDLLGLRIFSMRFIVICGSLKAYYDRETVFV